MQIDDYSQSGDKRGYLYQNRSFLFFSLVVQRITLLVFFFCILLGSRFIRPITFFMTFEITPVFKVKKNLWSFPKIFILVLSFLF